MTWFSTNQQTTSKFFSEFTPSFVIVNFSYQQCAFDYFQMSTRVGRQYLGCIGKVDNGQVSVAAGLWQADYFTPIDIRVFMPKSSEDDSFRRKKM